MRVLVACEFSGTVREAFRRCGHDAWSCDLLPTDVPGNHIRGNVLSVIADGWDLMVAHPPCTHLAVSGAPWFKDKFQEQCEALAFVRLLMDAPIPKIAIENPVSIISTRIRKPDQVVQPYWFGVRERKATCLWLKNLPLLRKTDVVSPSIRIQANGRTESAYRLECDSFPHHLRGKERSRTFQGFADAMAEQWG